MKVNNIYAYLYEKIDHAKDLIISKFSINCEQTCILPDWLYLKLKYKQRTGDKLHLLNPKTFNEKLQWLKLHDRKPEYSLMVDKYEAKKYIASIIGEEYIIPTLGVWDKFEDIDFTLLPDKFVLKATHDSGGVLICRDKNTFDYDKARDKINAHLANDYYKHGREWPYKNVKHRIIAEEYLEDDKVKELRDYKFFCFEGKPKFMYVSCDGSENPTTDFF